jgi:hypothetical protein
LENTNKCAFHEKLCKSQALHAGFAKAQGDVIITMDALHKIAGRDSGLYNMICNFDLVSGWKKKRYDSVVAKTYLLNYLMPVREYS